MKIEKINALTPKYKAPRLYIQVRKSKTSRGGFILEGLYIFGVGLLCSILKRGFVWYLIFGKHNHGDQLFWSLWCSFLSADFLSSLLWAHFSLSRNHPLLPSAYGLNHTISFKPILFGNRVLLWLEHKSFTLLFFWIMNNSHFTTSLFLFVFYNPVSLCTLSRIGCSRKVFAVVLLLSCVCLVSSHKETPRTEATNTPAAKKHAPALT